MYIKILDHGTGSGGKAAAYLLDEKDHQNVVRAGVQILQGDPQQFAALADSSPHRQKYTSVVLAWHKDDDPTPEEIKHTLAEFERTAFAGLEKTQYHMFAVRHDEADGSKHVHVLVPRIDLHSGKSMNIAPPGWKHTFDPLRDALNNEYGWARPDDPSRSREYQPDFVAYKDKAAIRAAIQVEPDTKALIYQILKQRIENGMVHDRADVLETLAEVGEIKRVGEDYISIKIDGNDKNTRLRGAIYHEQFTAENFLNTAREARERQEANTGTRETITAEHRQRAEAARNLLNDAIAKRTTYNQGRYPAAERSTERTLESPANEHSKANQREQLADTVDAQNAVDRLVSRITSPEPRGVDVAHSSEQDGTRVGRQQVGDIDRARLDGMPIWNKRQIPENPMQTSEITPEDKGHDRARESAFEAVAGLAEQFRAFAQRAFRRNEERKRQLAEADAAAHERRREHEGALRETLANSRAGSEPRSQWRERISQVADTVRSAFDSAGNYFAERISGIRDTERTAEADSRAVEAAGRSLDAGITAITEAAESITASIKTLEKQREREQSRRNDRGDRGFSM